MASLEQDNSNLSPQFRELECFNLFSQGNIYTTKIIQRPLWLPSKMSMAVGSPNLMVGTLKPPKILSIALSNMESYDHFASNREEGNELRLL